MNAHTPVHSLDALLTLLAGRQTLWTERWRERLRETQGPTAPLGLPADGAPHPLEGLQKRVCDWLRHPDAEPVETEISALGSRLADQGLTPSDVRRIHRCLGEVLLEAGQICLDEASVPAAQHWPLLHDLERRLEEQRWLLVDGASKSLESSDHSLLGAITKGCEEALLFLDREGEIQSWNPRAERLLAPSGRSLRELGVVDLFGDAIPPVEAWPHPGPEEEPPCWLCLSRPLADGEAHSLELVASPLYPPQGNDPTGWVLLCYDLSARKEMERQRWEAHQQLKLVNDIARSVAARRQMQELFDTLAEELRPLVPYDRISVALREEESDTLLVFAFAAGEHTPEKPRRVPTSETSLGRVLAEGRPYIACTAEEIARFPGDQAIVAEGICSHIALPLFGETGVMGTFNLCCREPRCYSREQLELLERVAQHLSLALENTRLLGEERKRSEQLRLVAELAESLARAALGELDDLLDTVSTAIHERFGFHYVGIYLCRPEEGRLELRAQRGAHRDSLPVGHQQDIETGLLGWVNHHGHALRVPQVERDPRYRGSSPDRPASGSEMVVPIWQNDERAGAITVQSAEAFAFDELDQTSLELVARLLGRTLENWALNQNTRALHELSDRIIDTMPSALALIDQETALVRTNQPFCRALGTAASEIIGRTLETVLPGARIGGRSLAEVCREVLASGKAVTFRELRLEGSPHHPRIMDLSCVRVEWDDQRQALLILEDVTERLQRMYHLRLLFQLSRAIQETLDLEDLDRLLHAILTCVTAGPGLGFNRASLYLVEGEELVERMRVGPGSGEEAHRLWSRLREKRSLEDFLTDYDRLTAEQRVLDSPRRLPLRELQAGPLREVLTDHEPSVVTTSQHDLCRACRELCSFREGIIAPLVARGQLKGIITADNFITQRRITSEDGELLKAFANQAALAISHAEAHRDRLLKEKLATVGDMTTRIAHEIRGPLVTIGGMARRMSRKLEDRALTDLDSEEQSQFEEYLPIISIEIQRLERILRNVLDYTRTRSAELREADLNRLIEETLTLHEMMLSRCHVHLEVKLDPDLPPGQMDPDQMKQVLFNLTRNALDAAREETEGPPYLQIQTWHDAEWMGARIFNNGRTIDPHDLPYVFNPFFTLRRDGTGLGLAIVKAILQEHGGEIEVDSQAGAGTTVAFRLPRQPPASQGEPR